MVTEAVVEIVVKAIEQIGPIVYDTVRQKVRERKEDKVNFDSISDFWKESKLREGQYVSIEGALSKYAPTLLGPPKAKREVHRAYRRSIPEEDYKNTKTVVDAYLAYTAGQMVLRLDFQDSQFVYLGLYHSIVRNAIPVFVDKDYYLNSVEKTFSKCRSPYVAEAKVKGRLRRIRGSFINEFIEKNKLRGLVMPTIINAGKKTFGIMVDGHNTGIEFCGPARYLDGDIWVGVDLNGKQFFVSRFVDLADPDDLYEESQNLKRDVKEFLPQGEIVFQFDQVDKLIPGFQKVTTDDLIKKFTQRP